MLIALDDLQVGGQDIEVEDSDIDDADTMSTKVNVFGS